MVQQTFWAYSIQIVFQAKKSSTEVCIFNGYSDSLREDGVAYSSTTERMAGEALEIETRIIWKQLYSRRLWMEANIHSSVDTYMETNMQLYTLTLTYIETNNTDVDTYMESNIQP